MKNLILLVLFLPLMTLGQEIKVHDENNDTDFYIDSIKFNVENVYLNKSSIEKVNVVKDGAGKIYISLKNDVELLNLNDLKNQKIDILHNKIYFIDNNLIRNPSKIQIDTNEIGDLKIIKSSEIENQTADFIIINITTKSKLTEIKNDKKEIRIRGIEQN
jgi:pantothenate kinase